MTLRTKTAAAVAGLALAAGAQAAAAAEDVTVAYFLEWPTANQVAQAEDTYSDALGANVEWRAFGNGNEMTQAMVSGDVDIAYSQGFVPFVVGVSNGAPLKLVGIAVTYSENDLCIVRDDSGITQENAAETLPGQKIATPIGNVTHYKLLKTLEHLEVDPDSVDLTQMNPADAAVALVRGDVPMACAFGGALDRMKTVGAPLMTGAEQEAIGISTFDVVTVTESFAEENPEMVRTFMDVTAEANAAYKDDPKGAYEAIAGQAGMDLDAAKAMLANFGFPSEEVQLQDNWMGGGVAEMAKGVADVMVEAGGMEESLDDYSPYIDASFLK
ncbi:taurine ABC transporter substrate-binding protein [Roseovarius salinarum]|uniref:taurine ABC transporter substrate-binding protein n=1 Tax=Roseovarius salinarum TaxID=1981892 RepID=UPI000C34A5E6|nr:ABC transporter substrate-binding protein [Roseovarius salinarum]